MFATHFDICCSQPLKSIPEYTLSERITHKVAHDRAVQKTPGTAPTATHLARSIEYLEVFLSPPMSQ